MYSVHDTQLMLGGFPHSEISGSKSVCRLPEAYRRLPRLSSPLTAKASTVCASSLDLDAVEQDQDEHAERQAEGAVRVGGRHDLEVGRAEQC